MLPQVRELLWAVYTQCYVEFVSKSPMSVAGEMVSSFTVYNALCTTLYFR